MNPIQGIVRGEAVVDGDASGGIDIVLYAVTSGWDALSDVGCTPAPGDPTLISTVEASFVSAMVGKTIVFAESGARVITQVISEGILRVDSPLTALLFDTFSMDGQESLRQVELSPPDELRITDVCVSQAVSSIFGLYEAGGVAGKRVAGGMITANGHIPISYKTPYVCSLPYSLTYLGASSGLNICLIHGYIT